jgi:hypothetical protein
VYFCRQINQYCGAGAARRRIFLVEPEAKHDAAPAPTAPALNLIFKIGGLFKHFTNCNIFYLFSPFTFLTISIKQKSKQKLALILWFTLVGLLYSRVGAGAASTNSPGAGAAEINCSL